MDAFAGPYAVAAVLLVVAGVLEARRPEATVGALARLGLGIPPSVVRVFAMLGALVGAASLAVGGGSVGRLAAALVAFAYAGFSGFVALALVRGGPLASCGCFGRDDIPPNATHLALDIAGFVAATAVVLWPGGGFRGAVAHQPGAGIPFLVMTAVCAGLASVSFTLVPGPRGRPRSASLHGAIHPNASRGPHG